MEFLWLDTKAETEHTHHKWEEEDLDFGQMQNSTLFGSPFAIGQGLIQDKLNGQLGDEILYPESGSAKSKLKGAQGDFTSLRLGERGVINPLWQYTKYADPRTSGPNGWNYGRVYNQKIRANNPIVFIQPGKPKFQGSGGYLSGLVGRNGGYTDKLKKAIVDQGLWGGVSKAAGEISFGIEDMMAQLQLFSSKGQNEMKFYDFEPDWGSYRSYVSELLMELQTRMGLTKVYDERRKESDVMQFYGSKDLLTKFRQFYGFWDEAEARSKISDIEVESSFLPFRIEKSSDAGDSFNNTIGESTFAGLAKQVPDAAKEAMYLTGGGDGGGLLGNVSKFLLNGATEVTQNISSAASSIIKNGGNLMFPEIWKDSGYSKTLSIVIKLHSPYADPVCYYENVLFPLACILGLALPRQVESAVYASPPILRLRSRGWFSVDMGIVESVSIKRGSDKNDWTLGRLPRSVEITLQIKDLYGTMMMSLMGASAKKYKLNRRHLNTALSDYLNTIGGLDTFQQTLPSVKFRQALERTIQGFKSMINPITWQQTMTGFASKFTPVFKIRDTLFR